MFIMTDGASPKEPSYQEMKKDPVWDTLDAVKSRHCPTGIIQFNIHNSRTFNVCLIT